MLRVIWARCPLKNIFLNVLKIEHFRLAGLLITDLMCGNLCKTEFKGRDKPVSGIIKVISSLWAAPGGRNTNRILGLHTFVQVFSSLSVCYSCGSRIDMVMRTLIKDVDPFLMIHWPLLVWNWFSCPRLSFLLAICVLLWEAPRECAIFCLHKQSGA